MKKNRCIQYTYKYNYKLVLCERSKKLFTFSKLVKNSQSYDFNKLHFSVAVRGMVKMSIFRNL